MVQAVDNLATISGRINSRSPHPNLEGYDLVNLVIERAEPVPDRANLFSSQVGQETAVAIRRELLGDAKPGDEVRCRSKRIPSGAICEPHPDPGDFAVTPS